MPTTDTTVSSARIPTIRALRPEYRYWVAGGRDVFPETNEDRILVHPEKSTSKGLEAYYLQDFGSASVRASYALSRVEEAVARVDNVNAPDPITFDPQLPRPRDQRHALNLDCTYRPNAAWSVNLAYAYHSGWPATVGGLVEIEGAGGAPDYTVLPESLYASRLPAYSRLDVRVTRRYHTRRGEVRLFAELINMPNRENVFAYDYEKETDANGDTHLIQDAESWFPLLPSIGVSWTGGF